MSETCDACGAVTLDPARHVITPDRVRGNGREHIWRRCTGCDEAEHLRALDQAVACDLLDLDVGDPVLDALRVPRFADLRTSTPERPNAHPWAHVDVEALAAEVAAWREANAARSGGPCSACGVSITPPGTTWRAWRTNNEPHAWCGRCQHHFGRWSTSTEHVRDAAALVLTGLAYGNRAHWRVGIGRELGLVLWGEVRNARPNSTAWAHLDVDAMRRHVADLITSGAMRRPSRWRPDRAVTW